MLTRTGISAVLMAAALAASLAPGAAAKDTFKNLPGVKDPAAKQATVDPVCTSQLVRRWPSQFPERNGLAYRAYSCEENDNVAVGSNRPPNLIEYRKFKQYYQSN